VTKDITLRVLTAVLERLQEQIVANPTPELCNSLHTLLMDYQQAFQANNVSLLKRVDERVCILEGKQRVWEEAMKKRQPAEPKGMLSRMG
jgi:hypothetical protein